MKDRLFAICAICLGFLPPLTIAAEIPKVYYLGDCLPSSSPIGYISDDPALDVIAVPATAHEGWFTKVEVARALRLYLPRTYEQLIEGNMMLLSDVRADTILPKWLNWFTRSIEEDGMSLMMIGGILSFGGYSGSPSWEITSIGPLLPVGLIEQGLGDISWKPVVAAPDDPLMTALPWSTCPHFGGYNKVTLKEGAKLLAETNDEGRNPFMVIWTVGTGLSFAFCTDWTPGWGVDFREWEFYADFTVYSVYYGLGREVPQDLELMHLLRADIVGYRTERDILISLINFVEKVGANTVSLEAMIRDADLIRKEAGELYVLQDYEGCVATLGTAREELKDIELEAVKVKSRALLWIWMVEWLVVTSTLMITGFILWTVMIRRRLYREVGTTRTT